MITPPFSLIKKIKKKIYNLSKPTLRPNLKVRFKESKTFSKGDLVLNKEARVTPIVLKVGMMREGVDKCRVMRVLIDTKATKSILYFKCFKEMEMNDSHLKSSNMVLEGFTAHKINVKGIVKISVTLGSDNCTQEEELKFYVIDIDSPYNAILGTSAYAAFGLVVSMSHQQVRFTTKNWVGFVKSSPKSLLGYMMKSRKQLGEVSKTSKNKSILTIEGSEAKGTPNKRILESSTLASKLEEFKEVAINPNYPS